MAEEKALKVREPNILIEAKNLMSKEEAILWLYCLTRAKLSSSFRGEGELKLEEAKKQRREFYAYTEINLPALEWLTELLVKEGKISETSRKVLVTYYKSVLQKLVKKIGFEVDIPAYKKILKELDLEYLIEVLNVPDENETVFWGIPSLERVELNGEGTLKIVFSKYVSPLVLLLRKWFTTYSFIEVVRLNSRYSIILYRLAREKLGLKQNKFFLPIKEVKRIFGLSNKIRAGVISRDVLKPAVGEINSKTSLKISVKTVRAGRGGKAVGYEFAVEEIPLLCRRDWSREVLSGEEINSLVKMLKLKNEKGEELSLEEVLQELKSFQNLSQAVVIWYLFHFPEETRWYALQTAKSVDANTGLTNHDKFLEKTIPQPKNEKEIAGIKLKELLDERVKVAIKKYFEELKMGDSYSSISWEEL
jgi:hypothetical protein